tara:strand:+ start:156 stop:383 length:228 start_codon:yes stop_codon:yes gene_type:complete
MHKIYNLEKLYIKDAASVLELDSSQVSRLFRAGRIRSYQDHTGKQFTKEADLIEFLSGKLPTGFVARSENILTTA